MDFLRQLEDIFGIDVWELKPEYRFTQQIETQIITEKLEDTKSLERAWRLSTQMK
ncbi:hypothetical protein ACP8HZ_05035 [Francisella noatunensis]